MEMKDSWTIPVNKFMFWRAGTWVNYENKMSNIFLRLHCDQILVTNNNKVLESLNMNRKMKGIFKADVLIIVCATGQEIRKFKFQIKSDALQHYQKLGEHFPVVSHNSSSKYATMQYRKVEDVFKTVLDEYKDNTGNPILPSNFKDFIKLCIFDPTFPQVVHETQKIIETQINMPI